MRNNIPTMRRQPLPGGRQRRRAIAVDCRETGGFRSCLLGRLNFFVSFKLIIQFAIQLFSSIHFLPSDCVVCSGQDVAFNTPVRPILRRKHILAEIDPLATHNSTAASIYSPIVRFVSPSKESKCSCVHWKTVLYCG